MGGLADALQDDEQILFQTRPRGRPPLLRDVLFYAQWIVVAIAGAYFWIYVLKRPLFVSGPLAPLTPLALLPFVAALVLYQWAAWQAIRFAVTTERVLVARGVVRTSVQAWARTPATRARRTLDDRVLLEGVEAAPVELTEFPLEELEALQSALGAEPSASG